MHLREGIAAAFFCDETSETDYFGVFDTNLELYNNEMEELIFKNKINDITENTENDNNTDNKYKESSDKTDEDEFIELLDEPDFDDYNYKNDDNEKKDMYEEEDLNWSFEGRDSASTIQAGKMLGLDIKRKEGKMFVNGEYMDHLTREKPMKIPRANLKGEYKSKTRSKITPKQYEDTKAQTRFRQRSESYWKKQKGILGDQITDPETGEIYDQASIQPYQQRQINKTLGLSEEHDVGEKIIGDEYDHPIPARIVKKIGGSRDFGIGTPLSHKTHIEREDPASTIPKAFRRRIQKARLKIARLKLAFRGKRSMGKPLPKLGIPFKGGNVDNIINTWKRNPLSRRQKGGYTFDPVNNEFLDASNRKQALKIRSVFKAEKGKNFGINSITDTKKGVEPVRNINRIHKELYDIENNNDIPIIGGYEDSLEASYPVSGSNRDILKRLNKNQKESLIIEPDGLAYTEDRKGKRTTLTKD